MSEKALEGIKVLEIAEMYGGPFCGKLLANMGAEVIKIERPETGDPLRSLDIAAYLFLNTDKYGVTLNLRSEKGKKIFRKMVKTSDILIVSGRPVEMKELGINYDELKEINPTLIMTSVSPFGLSGPHSDYKAYTLNIANAGGHSYLLPRFPRIEGRPPVMPGGNVAGYDGGAAATIGTLAALFYQKATGIGQLVEISEQEAQMDLQRVETVLYPQGGTPVNRYESELMRFVYGGIKQFKNGWVNIAAQTASQVAILSKVYASIEEAPEVLKDPAWEKQEYLHENLSEYEKYADELNLKLTKEFFVEKCQAAGIAVTYVWEMDEMITAEHFNERELFKELIHPDYGKIEKFPSRPFLAEGTPYTFVRPAPLLGQHNEEIFVKSVGISSDELKKYQTEGII